MGKRESVVDRLSALLSQPPTQLNNEFKDGTIFARQSMKTLHKHPVLLEAWSGKVGLAVEEGLFELAGNLMLLGMEMLGACAGHMAAVEETNVGPSMVGWVNGLNLERIGSDGVSTSHEEYRVFARLLLTTFADLVEHEAFAKALFKDVHLHLAKLMSGRGGGCSAVRVARAAADCFTTATVKHKHNKAIVNHKALVKVFAKAADLPLKESLVIIIRKCVLNAPQPLTDSQQAAAEAVKAALSEEMYQQFLYSGKTELGSLEFAVACLEAGAAERKVVFSGLPCPSWQLHDGSFRAKDFQAELGTSQLLCVYAHEKYMTLQRPDDGSWMDIAYGNIEEIRYSASEGAVLVHCAEAKEALKFDVKESPAGKRWVRAVCELLEQACSEVAASEFFPAHMALPTPMTAAQERERMRALQRKAAMRDVQGGMRDTMQPVPAVPETKQPPPRLSGRKREKEKDLSALLNFDVPEESELAAPAEPRKRRRKTGGLLDGFGLESDEEGKKPAQRLSAAKPTALRIDLPDLGKPSRQKPSGEKTLGGRWEAPASLLDVDWSCNDDDASSDDDVAMDRMKSALTETVLKAPDNRPVEELHEMMQDVQRMVDNTKARKIDIPREQLKSEVEVMKSTVQTCEDRVPEVTAKEREVTKDIQTLHGEFVRASRAMKKDFHELLCDLDDVMPNNQEMHEKINSHIETMVARGFEVVKRKEEKKRKKSDAILNMFDMLTREFTAKAP